jgi:hypothetical protein
MNSCIEAQRLLNQAIMKVNEACKGSSSGAFIATKELLAVYKEIKHLLEPNQ